MIDYEITVDVSNADTETKKRVQDAYFKLGFVWSNGSNGTKYNCLDRECYTNTFRQGLAPRGFLMWAGVPREPTHTVDELLELAGMKTKADLKPFDLEKALNGEPVVLRDGSKAYIRHHETQLKTNYPLIGYVADGKNEGEELGWTECGRHCWDQEKSEYDIVGMWVEPLAFKHWSLLREDIKYLAKDRVGVWYGYSTKPTKERTYWLSHSIDDYCSLEALKLSLFPDCDWENSLIERPKND